MDRKICFLKRRASLCAMGNAISDADAQNNDVPEGGTEEFVLAGIAHAQSRPRCPFRTAIAAFSSLSSVAPIHNMYESTRLVTWQTMAGVVASEDG